MIDVHSQTWREVCEHAIASIESLRNTLERRQDEENTTRLRGKIEAYRELLRLPDKGTTEPSE